MKSVKLSINQITGRDNTMEAFDFPRTRQASDLVHSHEHRYKAFTDTDSHAQSEFGMDSTGTISATASSVDFSDQTG
jgi:hypothetical protein